MQSAAAQSGRGKGLFCSWGRIKQHILVPAAIVAVSKYTHSTHGSQPLSRAARPANLPSYPRNPPRINSGQWWEGAQTSLKEPGRQNQSLSKHKRTTAATGLAVNQNSRCDVFFCSPLHTGTPPLSVLLARRTQTGPIQKQMS